MLRWRVTGNVDAGQLRNYPLLVGYYTVLLLVKMNIIAFLAKKVSLAGFNNNHVVAGLLIAIRATALCQNY